MTGDLSPGSRALLVRLARRPELNNNLCVLVEFLNEEGRWKVRLLGHKARSLSPGPICVLPEKLRRVPSSALIMTLPGTADNTAAFKVQCWSYGYGHKGIRLMYDAFLGREALIPVLQKFFCFDPDTAEEDAQGITNEMYGIPSSPYQGHLGDNECVIVKSKHEALYNALVDFECIQFMGRTVQLGMHRDPRVCKILFEHTVE
ncbi:unnamed protein product [Vitrella brassicaformis CCMP3155]|uniref:Uncharacterized protein n=1 Tax=Vitrella brassicaformis (strain CCMP3155) TaxID=1169540 RepID=A0A0G4G8E2_VITBC|nr:unnamed protein product [Vitrella brassicaformis CCMP3155]|mmetsp:Transcript_42462/g.105961  ORF Transcript_42462/g.105961 Transcript_42462/m.105961 type:complete len:203 (-) Transcript_42462:1648-2256(-)|eukprot:CEM25152.1 unnamed protein product [Vitrella brassicaformis CCMP3155]